MQLSFVDYHKIDYLEIYFYEVADRSHILVLLQSAHQSLAQLPSQLQIAFLLRSLYKRYFLAKLPSA